MLVSPIKIILTHIYIPLCAQRPTLVQYYINIEHSHGSHSYSSFGSGSEAEVMGSAPAGQSVQGQETYWEHLLVRTRGFEGTDFPIGVSSRAHLQTEEEHVQSLTVPEVM